MDKESALNILNQARNLIDKGHCIGYYAVDQLNQVVSCHSNSATCFCAYGAIYRIDNYKAHLIIRLIESIIGTDQTITSISDAGKESCLNMFDRVIESLNNGSMPVL